MSKKQEKYLNEIVTELVKLSIGTLIDISHKTISYKNGLSNPNESIKNEDIQNEILTIKNLKSEKYNIRNILGFQKTNDEFYTPKEPIINLINELKIPKNKTIWCPFDKNESEFVIQLKLAGYKVKNTHIDWGQNFYEYEPNFKWDLIISNPPFSNKRLLIERCYSFKKDFCLLYGTTIFSQSMGNTLNKCKFLFIQRNIKFSTKDNSTKSFQCCWVMNKNFEYFKG